MRGSKTGRLLQYDPKTEKVAVLARGFWFANGVSVDKDETHIVIADSFGLSGASQYHLSGPKAGTLEPLVHSYQLPGFTDGVDCSRENTGPSAGKCYVAVPAKVLPIMTLLYKIPPPFDRFLRGLLMMLPRWLSPEPEHYGCFAEVDMKTGEVRIFQDPDAQDMMFVTGVTFHDNKLYLGSLKSDVVGVYDLT